jgi:hypothetical protein
LTRSSTQTTQVGRERETGVWVAYSVFGLCMVGAVASYFWSPDYVWWPVLFSVIGIAVMLPVLFGRSVRAIISAFKS